MTALVVAFLVTWGVFMLVVLAICADSAHRDRHPSQWSPAGEEHIVQAVAVVDDGKALVAETEAFLKWSADA